MNSAILARSLRPALLGFAMILGMVSLPLSATAEKYASIVVASDTGTVLHARHADAERHPASLTKVMALYMLFDEIEAGRIALDDRMTVSRRAAKQPPSNLRLKAGGTIEVADAIDALVTKSANDVAVVIAEHIADSEDRFAALMTVKARTLGMNDTLFMNASGLHDPEQVTTARDMARLAEAMMGDHPDFYAYFSTSEFKYGRRTYKNHNKLLGNVDGVDGIKTGYTRASGFNLMAAAERDEQRVVAIMLGGHSALARNGHVTELIEAAFHALAPDDAPALTEPGEATPLQTVSFDAIADPIHPNAAAVPMLNGKPFVVAEGDGD
ncbi:MAG: D-alanyl-D-alanine carboxypeptidase family protein [Pseudomonadota bacterium]